MAKRKVSNKTKKRLLVFGSLSIFFIFLFVFSLLYNIYTIYDLTKDKKNLENSYLFLQEKAEQLKIDIEKLSDKEYLANYARENYSYSKDGEYIIKLVDDVTETTQTIDKISIEINKNYIIIGLSALMILILVFVRAKSKAK